MYATFICSNAPRCLISDNNNVKHEQICFTKALLNSNSRVATILTMSPNINDDSFVVRQQQRRTICEVT